MAGNGRKPGTRSVKQETREQFAARVGKELREEANRMMSEAEKEAQRVRSEAKKQAKEIRKVAASLDGHRS